MARAPQTTILSRAVRFFEHDLWDAGTARASGAAGAAVQALRVAVLTVEGFLDDLCLLRASALTYATLMALVPVLALAFAILRGLGWRGERLESLILTKVTVLSPEAIESVVAYIDNTNVAGLGALGGIVLILTFVSVMGNIEASMNAIWGRTPPRPWLRKLSDYLAVLVAGPLLLGGAISATAVLQSNASVVWLAGQEGGGLFLSALAMVAPFVIVWALFTLLYIFVPNTRVEFGAALIGAIVAGTVWQLTQSAYVSFQFGMSKYNAIYGAMAQIPILMAWMYVSWVIVLAGAELAAAVQNLGAHSEERRRRVVGYGHREYLGLAMVAELAAAAHARSAPPTVEQLSARLAMPVRTVRELMADLGDAGLVHLGGGDQALCFLSLAPASLPVVRVLEVLRGATPATAGDAEEPANARVAELLETLREGRDSALEGVSVASLVA
jgi:membrane protein